MAQKPFYNFAIQNEPLGNGELCSGFREGSYTCDHGHVQTSACKYSKPSCGCDDCPSVKVPSCMYAGLEDDSFPKSWHSYLKDNPDYADVLDG